MKRIAACVTCSPSTSLRRSKRIDSTITTQQLRTNQLLNASSLKRSSDGVLTYTWFRNTWNTVHTILQSSFTLDPSTNIFPFGAAFSAQVFKLFCAMIPYYMNLCLSNSSNCVSLGLSSSLHLPELLINKVYWAKLFFSGSEPSKFQEHLNTQKVHRTWWRWERKTSSNY